MENILCIVLRSVDYKDCDKMLTLFSRTEGRLTALASGAKNLKNPNAAASQPFCCGIFTLAKKKDKYYVGQCEIKKEFYSLGSNYENYTVACVMMEITEKILSTAVEYERLFVLLVNCLYHLESGMASRQLLAYFFVHIADLMGIRPVTDECVVCGQKIAQPHKFSMAEGGVVCTNCEKTLKTVKVNPEMMQCIDNILQKTPIHFTESSNFPTALLALMQQYLDENGDVQSRAAKYL